MKAFSELFVDGEPVAVGKREWQDIQIPAQRAMFRRVCLGAESVPEWVMFTKHGMACKVCM